MLRTSMIITQRILSMNRRREPDGCPGPKDADDPAGRLAGACVAVSGIATGERACSMVDFFKYHKTSARRCLRQFSLTYGPELGANGRGQNWGNNSPIVKFFQPAVVGVAA